MATEVSSTRLYLGNLPRNATKADVENHFAAHGTGEITEIKLMNGFGFIEYKDAMDARDVVPAFHGSDFMGERLVVQFARGSRRNEPFAHQERTAPRPRRTAFRMQITGLPVETSWQDLKDFARQSGLDVVYSEVSRDRDGKGFVEYETGADLTNAVEKLDNREFKGQTVRCIADYLTFHRFNPSVLATASDPARRHQDVAVVTVLRLMIITMIVAVLHVPAIARVVTTIVVAHPRLATTMIPAIATIVVVLLRWMTDTVAPLHVTAKMRMTPALHPLPALRMSQTHT
ncbi:hypothetical protein H2201_001838 [Coniosporium apollinis]|uniref:RRM domain-containing protein n=2 Tax=Coniosporium TaxID=2810619 RepID=A0ABQ9P6M1_9PEZI|nr:hypothetical protein H2199_000472 [Cladosporium sp. JES 115]KAJ9668032.1 hypothetical protein H2201_001838 [Coniosporium apollinis]